MVQSEPCLVLSTPVYIIQFDALPFTAWLSLFKDSVVVASKIY